MNRELISRLYNEAVDYCVKLGPNSDDTNRAWVWEEKFAELFISECIELIKPCQCGCTSEDEQNICNSIIKEIQNHFGVENE